MENYKFIYLTKRRDCSSQTDRIILNPAFIGYVEESVCGSHITTIDGNYISVTESPNEICKKLGYKPLNK